MLASINDLGNISIYSFLIFLVLAILGLPKPARMSGESLIQPAAVSIPADAATRPLRV